MAAVCPLGHKPPPATVRKEECMSVPKYRRSENKLQAITDTVNMSKYAIQMCENEKIFPKKCRWTLCNKLINTCIKTVAEIRQANSITVKTKEDAEKRIGLQKSVLLDFEAIWSIMTIAEDHYSIPNDKIAIWSNLMLTAEDKVKAWKDSDVKRYSDLLKM